MAKELICTGVRQIAWRAWQPGPLAPQQVRVRPQFAAPKHGTEMAVYKGDVNRRGDFDAEYQLFHADRRHPGWSDFPVALGNMFVGVIEETGAEVRDLKAGEQVLAFGSLKDLHQLDAAACWKVPAGLAWQSAVCLDPGEFALSAVRDGNVRPGDAVAVFGMGAIGLIVVQLARQVGACPVIAVEPLANRRAAAIECGAHEALNPSQCDAGLEIKKLTGKVGADVCVDYSGDTAAPQAAIRGVAYGGTVVLGSFPAPYGPGLDFGAEGHMNVPKLIFSRSCSEPCRDHPRWTHKRNLDACWRLIREGVIRGQPIVQPIVRFEDLLREYPKIETNPESNIKLGVRY